MGCERLISHRKYLQLLGSARRFERYAVAFARLDQRARDGRNPAHVAACGVDLVHADDTDRAFPFAAAHGNGRAKEYLVFVVGIAPHRRVDHLAVVEPPDQKANAPIDFAQALLAVDVVAIFGAISVARGPRHYRHDTRPLLLDESSKLGFEARKS